MTSSRNTYALLAWFLSPLKSTQSVQAVLETIRQGRMDWGRLLYQANLQLCTPLWYVRLKQDGLLELLPEDLQAYLGELYRANGERNLELRSALVELLRVFAREGISVVLLKGAATFRDDLYRDPGARMLRDLDILVHPEDTARCRDILLSLGYTELSEPEMQPQGLPTDDRHHHLPPFHRPGTPVVVEVHFKVAYGQCGRMLPAAEAWENLVPTRLDGMRVSIFDPTWRLLHNTAHALVPQGEFIRGDISLSQLAEFAALVYRYGPEIDWAGWFDRAKRQGLATEFSMYLALAIDLMAVPKPPIFAASVGTRCHLRRILLASCLSGRPEGEEATGLEKLAAIGLKAYYFLHLPRWVWRNVCFTEESGLVLVRLRFLLKKSMSTRSRCKISWL